MKAQLAVLGCLMVASCLAHVAVAEAPVAKAEWAPVKWRGERAFELLTATWRAVVSAERGRLVHFGPVGEGNLLFESDSRENLFSWGGHRVWLGPQAIWGWPPPDAWERAAAERVTAKGGRLELLVPEAGRGFPRFTRVYELDGTRLACRIALAAGGTEAMQVMQILQTPASTVVDLQRAPSARWPRGYFRVGGAVGPNLVPDLPLPAGVTETAAAARIAFAGRSDKLAFPPQTLFAQLGAHRLALEFGGSRGPVVAAPDEGFYTQVYIGDAASPVVEIEQLSPQYAAGAAAEFSMYLDLTGGR